MSYIGKVELKASDIKRYSGTISGTPTFVTLDFTAANSNSLLFYLNGVKQSTSLYDIAGSPTVITLKAAGTFTAADTWEAIGINDVGTTIVPADGTVTRPKLSVTETPDGAKFLRDDMSWRAIPASGTIGDITTANNFFQNWNTIDVNTTSTFATTINAAIIGPITVTGSYVWTISGILTFL
jgi:hypothetical protein